MKRDFETMRKRMDDFYFRAITPDGEEVILSSEKPEQPRNTEERRKGKNIL